MIRIIRKTLHGFDFWRRWRKDDPVIREAATARDAERGKHRRSREFQDALTARRTDRLRAQFGEQASAMRADRRKRALEALGDVASAFALFAGGAAIYVAICPLDAYASDFLSATGARKGEFGLYALAVIVAVAAVVWIVGKMISDRRPVPPTFDDPDAPMRRDEFRNWR